MPQARFRAAIRLLAYDTTVPEYSFWSELDQEVIKNLRETATSLALAKGPVDLEIVVAGADREAEVRQVRQWLSNLSRYGIRVRVTVEPVPSN